VYPDDRAAVAWLSEVFGFVERVRIGGWHATYIVDTFIAGASR
jgi:hypothetical protein